MRHAILKSLVHILNDAYGWEMTGMYYKIQVTPAVTIGFRKPYKKYLDTHVTVERKLDRKGRWRPGIYTVFARNGNPIFIAHRRWFSAMADQDGMLNTVEVAPMHLPDLESAPASAGMGSMAASGMLAPKSTITAEMFAPVEPVKTEPLGDLSWEELFDI
jgi:hypothetical protein